MLARGFLIYQINSPGAGISFVEGISVWRREDLRAVRSYSPAGISQKAKSIARKSDMSRLTRRRTTNQLRLEFIERNDVIHFCSLPLGELMMLILDVYSQRTVPPGE